MNWLIIFSILISLLYFLRMVTYRRNWENLPSVDSVACERLPGLSVVIAFRNEEKNLPALLAALEAQDYPMAKREFILVDDHSLDGSAGIASVFSASAKGFQVLQCETDQGKKAALQTGIGRARFPYIVTTDADCTMGKSWLTTMAYALMEEGIVMGPVDQEEGRGFFGKFGEMEFSGLNAAGAAAAAGDRPIFCSGANLAYPVALFQSVADPMRKDIASGDDTLFMLGAKRRSIPVRVVKNTAAMVTTRASQDWQNFITSRVRWAIKPAIYADADVLGTALLITLQALILPASLLSLPAGGGVWLFPVLVILKYAADTWFLHAYLTYYNKRMPWMRMLAFEVIYPLYILITLGMGVAGKKTWKGRRYVSGSLISSRVRKGT